MATALLVLGLVVVAIGVAGVLLPVVPGAPLVFAGIVLVAWADHFTRIGAGTLAALGVLALLAFAADYAAGVLGAKRMGATRWGILGAIAGTVVGIFFGLPGLVLGPAVGAVALEYWKNPDLKKASKAGFGTVLGFAIGVAAKCAIVFMMIGIAAVAYFV